MTLVVEHPTSRLRRRWRLAAPLRWALRSAPIPRGRYRLGAAIARVLYPDQDLTFEVVLSKDVRVPFRYGEAVARQILYFGEFERAETAYFSNRAAGSTAFDVGANVGYFTLTAATHDPTARLIAIEPLPGNCRRLARASESLSNITLVEQAVGSAPGLLRMSASGDGALATVSESGELEVQVTTLDAIWRDIGRPSVSVIKIDVEGFEVEVLNGAHEVLDQVKPDLILEAWDEDRLQSLCRTLEPFGYSATKPAGFEAWNYLFRPN